MKNKKRSNPRLWRIAATDKEKFKGFFSTKEEDIKKARKILLKNIRSNGMKPYGGIFYG